MKDDVGLGWVNVGIKRSGTKQYFNIEHGMDSVLSTSSIIMFFVSIHDDINVIV